MNLPSCLYRYLLSALILFRASVVLGQAAPRIDSVSSRRAEIGSLITLDGINFLNPVVTKVYFNFAPGLIQSIGFIAGGRQRITVRVPADATIGPLIVENAYGQSQTSWNFQVPPVITRFEKLGVATEIERTRGIAGDTVLITGANFMDSTDPNFQVAVFFDGVRGIAQGITEGAVSVFVPLGAGSGPITVANPVGSTTSAGFFYIPPTVTAFTPRARTGDAVSITGRSFRAVTSVSFGPITTTNLITVSATNLSVIVPTNAPAFSRLAVESIGGRFLTSSNFVLLPRISDFTPTFGSSGSNIIINGTGLTSAIAVLFGGITTQPFVVSPTQIRATLPFEAGTGPITVITSNGQDTSIPLFYVPPKITSLSPNRLRAGEALVLTGTNFTGTTDVQFGPNQISATSYTVNSNHKITAIVPERFTSGRVRLVTPGGQAESSSILTVQGLEPIITGFSPANGEIGTLLQINGKNLTSITSIRLGEIFITQFQPFEGGLSATIPQGSISGPIRVETSEGFAVSTREFLVGSTVGLSVEIISSSNPVVTGIEFRLFLRIRNSGPLSTSELQCSLSLPATLNFRGTTPSSGTFNRTAKGLLYNPDPLSPGASWTSQVRLEIPTESQVSFQVSVTNSIPDPILSDNQASTTVEATPLRLKLTAFGETLVLSWPSGIGDVVLQESATLNPLQWFNSVLVPLDDGLQFQATLNATNQSNFFQVIKN